MTLRRRFHLVNLDPAAEHFPLVQPSLDIQDCITLEEVMDGMDLGPNGGLVCCLETLVENFDDWLDHYSTDDVNAGDAFEDDFLVIDCPGQIELYTHYSCINDIISNFQRRNYAVAIIYCLESSFLMDPYKFLAGTLSAMSAMAKIQVPYINVITKMDLVDPNLVDSSELDM